MSGTDRDPVGGTDRDPVSGTGRHPVGGTGRHPACDTGRHPVRGAEQNDDVLDDYALVRVPEHARCSWLSVAVQRFGQVSSFQQFLVGAVLGFGMSFRDAVIAITVGSVMLEVITILLGIAGVREGVSVSVLARWSGFGRKGSALVGLLIALSLAGWFGVQNGVFARGMHDLAGGTPEWVWALIGGAVITVITVFGFTMMAWTAYLTVPAFLFLAGYSIIDTLAGHSLADLMAAPPPGPAMSLAEGTTLVSGAFILGAIMTPDMTRFNRRPADVVKQTLISVTLGEYLIGLTAVLLAQAAKSVDIVGIIGSSSGLLGTLVLATAILKINDWNLYSSSLGLVNSVDVLIGRRVGRRAVTWVIGAAGTALSAIGIVDNFTDFLETIGVLAPPVAGIIIAEYYVVRQFRPELDRARAGGTMPAQTADWMPLSLVCWAFGSAVGKYLDAGIPAINSVLAALLLYIAAGKALMARRASSVDVVPLAETDLTKSGG
ncbi:purine-cytosine permease family protein [Streptomyces sp. NPDC017941]|uniref:purine-cytosine permease family protein n=1 Tax=Streptomyces sp. NPDC017941 TaxID=3365018 RepID=UPI00378FA5A5